MGESIHIKKMRVRIKELVHMLAEDLEKRANEILDLNSVVVDEYEDNFYLPKLCVYAAQERLRYGYYPFTSSNKNEADRFVLKAR